MNLDAKISAATRCLEREYPNGMDEGRLEFVIAEIKREHRAQFHQRVANHVKSLLRMYVKVAQLMQAERLGLPVNGLRSQH